MSLLLAVAISFQQSDLPDRVEDWFDDLADRVETSLEQAGYPRAADWAEDAIDGAGDFAEEALEAVIPAIARARDTIQQWFGGPREPPRPSGSG